MDYEGNVIRADRLLEDVRKLATDYAVHQILHNGFAGEISDLTRFYVLYRWDYGAARVPFDDARKLATSCSIDLANEWGRRGFIKKEREFIRVLGPQDRNLEDMLRATSSARTWTLDLGVTLGESKKLGSRMPTSDLIEVLHCALLLWEKGARSEMIDLLGESGFGESEAFYRVAQAISETLPVENKEKKLLDGFLSGRERLREELKDDGIQGRLF